MKKILGLGTLALAGVLAFTGCSCSKGEDYEGGYSYANPHSSGSYYGAKVVVTVEDDKITAVELLSDSESGWTNLSAANPTYGWTEEDRTNWTDNVEDFLASFIGMTVEEVKELEVTTAGNGEPSAVEGMDIVTGATQSSGRVILAIQDALADYKAE